MNNPLLTWSCIIGLMLLIVIIKVMRHLTTKRHGHHLIELGSEYEEFYVPGDLPITDDDNEY